MLFRQRSARHPHRRALTRFLSCSNFQVTRLAFERSTRCLTIRRGIVESPPRSLFRQQQWNLFDPVGGTSINRCTSRRQRYRSRFTLPLSTSFSFTLSSIFLPLPSIVSLPYWIGKFTGGQLYAIFNAGTRKQWTYLADGSLRPWPDLLVTAVSLYPPKCDAFDDGRWVLRPRIDSRETSFWKLDRRALAMVPLAVSWTNPFNSCLPLAITLSMKFHIIAPPKTNPLFRIETLWEWLPRAVRRVKFFRRKTQYSIYTQKYILKLFL